VPSLVSCLPKCPHQRASKNMVTLPSPLEVKSSNNFMSLKSSNPWMHSTWQINRKLKHYVPLVSLKRNSSSPKNLKMFFCLKNLKGKISPRHITLTSKNACYHGISLGCPDGRSKQSNIVFTSFLQSISMIMVWNIVRASITAALLSCA
jgi:hypothetical protein